MVAVMDWSRDPEAIALGEIDYLLTNKQNKIQLKDGLALLLLCALPHLMQVWTKVPENATFNV